jgi:cobyrinic acid a,c-diamide synthase
VGVPRVLVAGLRGGGGKTLVAAGLARAWRRAGHRVAPFKKGPDYIDAAWLGQAAGAPCRNLDAFLLRPEAILRSFAAGTSGMDVAVIEANRGLFDGADARGTYSSAELAKLLRVPVVLVVDCTKATRTVAAEVLGCRWMDPDVDIRGVVLNRTAGDRHESVVRESVESVCGIPVVGALPRLDAPPVPERHLGLVPPAELVRNREALERVASLVEGHLELDLLWKVAAGAPPLDLPTASPGGLPERRAPATGEARVEIGVFRDAAFQFYYPENLAALEAEGAVLVEISPLEDPRLPKVDALYVGGGFPESFAAELAANGSFRASLRRAVKEGLPVYAECGGAVYLGEHLSLEGDVHAMAGAVPAVFGFGRRPDGHGYTVLEAVESNPFFPEGSTLKGHEFHYTHLVSVASDRTRFAFRVRRGHGFDGTSDGLCYRNVLASYTHLHALGTETWAPALVRAAARHRALATPVEEVML